MERFRRLQDGRNSQYSSTDTYRIEHNVSFAQGAVEVREYAWADPKADTWTCASHFLDFSLAPRPASTWAGYLDEGQIRNRLGRIKFVPAGRTVRSGGAAGKHRSMHCLLSTEMFDNLLPNRPSWDAVAVSDGLCLSGRDIEWLLYKIYGELKHSSFAAPVVVESFATALAVALIRKFHPGRLGARAPRSGGLAPWRMRRIRDRVYGEQAMPSLSELAEVCGMSVRHLSRAFKFETGETIANYVERAMVERAYELLGGADASVSDIARALGFSGAASFAGAFRRATGIRPSDVEGRRRSRTSSARCLVTN